MVCGVYQRKHFLKTFKLLLPLRLKVLNQSFKKILIPWLQTSQIMICEKWVLESVYRVQQRYLSLVGRVNDMGVIIYSFNLNISPKMSCGMLECDLFLLQNYMLMTL